MKAFLIFATVALLYFFGQNIGWAFQNQTDQMAICRQEIEQKIDSAMNLGDASGITLLLARLPDYKKCLPPQDTALGNLYHKTAVLCYINDRYSEAIHWFHRALEIRHNNPSAPRESLLKTLNGLTQTHLQNFDSAEAEQCIERQITLLQAQKSPNREVQADLFLADAQLAFQREDFVRCREKLGIAANFYKEGNPKNPNLGIVFNYSGAAANLLNAPDEALDFFRQARSIFEINGEKSNTAFTLHNMGIAFGKLTKPDSALVFLKKAAEIHQNSGDQVELARNFVEMAKIFEQQNDFRTAFDFFEKSLRLRENLLPDWHPDVLESQVFLGKMLLRKNVVKVLNLDDVDAPADPEAAALALFEKAIAAASRSPRSDQALLPMAEKAQVLAKKGAKNLGFARQAHSIFKKTDSLVQRARLNFRHDASKIAFAQTVRHIYENAILNALQIFEKTGDPSFFETALAFCENSKSAALRDNFRRRAAQGFAGLPDSVLQREQRLRLRVGAATEALLAAGKTVDSLRFSLQKALETAKIEQEEFNEDLEIRFPKYFELAYAPAKNPTMRELQNALPDENLLLEFFVGDSNLLVFGVSNHRFQCWREPRKAEILGLIRQFLPLVDGERQATAVQVCQLSRQIFRDVLEKPLHFFSEKEGTRRLRIVPDGWLAALPFGALLTDDASVLDANSPFLLKKYGVSLLFSHRLLLEKPPVRRWFGWSGFSIFGVDYRDAPAFFSEKNETVAAAELPFSAEEIRAVKRETGGEVFENRSATAAHFLKKMGESRHLHVAAHGVFNAENPLLSGLLFSKKSPADSLPNLLTVAGMYGLQTSADFIFLSACNTGRGELIESEGVMSFARALTYAGAKSQVMTLWEVGDRSTWQIAERFYHHLHRGLAKDEALRQAKLDYLAECPTAAGQHPFFWAGAVVFGDAEPLFVPVFWKWLAVFGLVLVAIFCWFFKKRGGGWSA